MEYEVGKTEADSLLFIQTYLKLSGVPFKVVPSSNHASPSGALPFLLPAASNVETEKMSDPIPSNKLRKWLATQSTAAKMQAPGDVRYEAYTSLVDSRIRKAWVLDQSSSMREKLLTKPNSSTNSISLQQILHSSTDFTWSPAPPTHSYK